MIKILILLFSICVISQLSAQNPGDLDLNYGDDGISIPEYTYGNYIKDIGILSDDKVISGGYYYNSAGIHGMLSYKFNTDGSLAPFGTSTWFNYHMGFDYEEIMAIYVLPDDNILLAGTTYSPGSGTQDFFIRLLPDGNLDPGFGSGGISYGADNDISPYGISVHYGLSGDYSIYVCGVTLDIDTEPAILKLDQNGQVASTFGANGLYVLNRPSATYKDIYLYSFSGNGYIYAAGDEFSGTSAFVSKHDIITGELEESFNTDGIFNYSHPTGSNIEANKLVFRSSLSENTIAFFGHYEHSEGDWDIYAIRLHCADGTMDNSFGVGGWSSLRVPGTYETINAAILQSSNNKYYFGGSAEGVGSADFMLGRLLINGFFDLSFGTNGLVLTDISENIDVLNGLALNADQSRIYAGGWANHFSNIYGTVACYYTGLGVGISAPESDDINISVYPNPGNDIVNIETGQDDDYQIIIHDLAGKKVLQRKERGNILQLDISELAEGMYLLKLTNSNNNSYISRLIKQ